MNRQQLRHPERHPVAVRIGYCHPGQVDGDFCASLTHTVIANPTLVKGVIAHRGGPRVAENRNSIIRNFIKCDDAEWLWFLDADMTFAPDTLPRLLAVADPKERPIIGGLCFAGGQTGYDGTPGKIFPTLYRLTEEGEYESIEDYPEGLVKVDATGAACVLIHMNALMAIGREFARRPDGTPSAYPWFQEGVTSKTGKPWGEDIALCARANALGIPLHVDTRIRIGHKKTVTIDEAMFRAREEVLT